MRPVITAFLLTLAAPLAADPSLGDGTYGVALVDGTGVKHDVAQLVVADGGYRLDWNEALFEDAFLSMRPFRCMTGPKRTMCRVPYPYENRRDVSSGDLTDLEYDLLFLWKRSGDYGINMWNGVYYDLTVAGDGVRGALHEMDMGILAVPPEAGNLRPVGPYDIEPGDPDSHWLPGLSIVRSGP